MMKVAKMPSNSTQRPYQYIETSQQLQHVCQQFIEAGVEWLAVDTEFVRVDTYFPELSLVQVATPQKEFYLLDPIAILANARPSEQQYPLQALVDLLANSKIRKVFHSARQDIEVLFQLQNVMPQNIFDTQIAAVFLGQGDLAGFARVIEAQLGVQLPKSQTRTNWHARPLSAEQIEYALDDVDYLVDLYQTCQTKLSQVQLSALQEDNDSLLQETLYITEPQQAWLKIKGTKRLKPKQLAIVQKLAAWRETHAVENNQPKKWSLSDEVIIGIAKRPPQTAQALYKVPNIKASSVREFGETLIQLIDEVFTMHADDYPQLPASPKTPSAEEESLLLIAQALSQQIARDYLLQVNNLTSKEDLLQLIREPQQSPMSGWRQLILGTPLQKWLSGHGNVCLRHQKITLMTD
ncbi:ribonuclease D [uncultured Thiomicrorhabdus sp.]